MQQVFPQTPQMLVITRGLQGSGKSTWAREWVAGDDANRVRINRDDLRFMLFGAYWFGADTYKEDAVTIAQMGMIRAALAAGKSVVCDDTHLDAARVSQMQQVAAECGVRFAVRDFHIDIATAVERDAARGERGERFVGEAVILATAAKYSRNGGLFPAIAGIVTDLTPRAHQNYYNSVA